MGYSQGNHIDRKPISRSLFSNHITVFMNTGFSKAHVVPLIDPNVSPANNEVNIRPLLSKRVAVGFLYSKCYGKSFASESGIHYGVFDLGQEFVSNLDAVKNSLSPFRYHQYHRYLKVPIKITYREPLSKSLAFTASIGISLVKVVDNRIGINFVDDDFNIIGGMYYYTNPSMAMSSTYDLYAGGLYLLHNGNFLKFELEGNLIIDGVDVAYGGYSLVGLTPTGVENSFWGNFIFAGNFISVNIGYVFSRTQSSFGNR